MSFQTSSRWAVSVLRFWDWRLGGTKTALLRGQLVNAVISLYDARFRLPRALQNALRVSGPFPVNLSPRCLVDPDHMTPDVDAVCTSVKA